MTDKKEKILHADDEVDTLDVVKTILGIEGYKVISVEDGRRALEELDLHDFDLMLLDFMMPDMSGLELYTQISTREEKHKVIFLTVLEATEERLEQLKGLGINDYITKPFDRDHLVERVNSALAS